jgi:hypothetical protein
VSAYFRICVILGLLLPACAMQGESALAAEIDKSLSLSLKVQRSEIAVSTMQLEFFPIVPGSMRIIVGRRKLNEGVDFKINSHTGALILMDPALLDRKLHMSWRYYRLDFPAILSLHAPGSLPVYNPDSTISDSAMATGQFEHPAEQSSQLRYSGSFLRGITVGSGGSVGMESGLRLKVDGQIGRNVEVEAFLSDRNSPIQPEGRSQSLEEIDRIHVKVRSPNWQTTLGDFDLGLSQGNYLQYARTVDGIQAGYRDEKRSLQAHAASARGRFNRMNIDGREGLQGPYQLLSEQSNDNIVVLAGSEQVWIDGIKLSRGEDRDYVIDYSLAQLRFTARQVIAADSRITVEYQYSERLYSRGLFGINGSSELFTKNLHFEFGLVRERDDPDDPLDQFLDADDLEILKMAGDQDTLALGSGILIVEPGEGHYMLLDSTAGSWGHYSFLEEVPDSLHENYIYQLRFHELQANQGDYSRQYTSSGLIYYQFEGLGQANWAPVIPLVAAVSHDLLDSRLIYKNEKIQLSLESAVSNSDDNLFSSLDDNDNIAQALRLKFDYRANPFILAGRDFGRPGIRLLGISEEENFKTFTPVDEIEFSRDFGLSRQGSGTLKRGDIEVFIRKSDSLYARASTALLKRDSSESKRYKFMYMYRPGSGLWNSADLSKREFNNPVGGSDLESYSLSTGLDLQRDWLMVNVLHEEETGISNTVNRFRQYSARQEHAWAKKLTSIIDYKHRRNQFNSLPGQWEELSLTRVSRFRLNFAGNLSGSADWTHRILDYALADSVDSRSDIALINMRGRLGSNSWNLLYRAENSLQQQSLTQYIQVDSLQGDYSRDPLNPDIFVPDPDGNYLAIQSGRGPSVQLASLELEAALRSRLPGKIESETRISLQETGNHKNPADVYLLKPQAFLSDSTRRASILLRQDLDLREADKSSRRWRLRIENFRSLDQMLLNSANRENRFKAALRLRWSSDKGRYSLEFISKTQKINYTQSPEASRKVLANRIDGAWTIDLFKEWQLKLEMESEKGQEELQSISAIRASFKPVLQWRPGIRGSLRFWTVLQQAWSDSEVVPYELLSGARIGRTLRAAIEGRYKIGKKTQFSLSWKMDQLPERDAIHSASAQIQSFF